MKKILYLIFSLCILQNFALGNEHSVIVNLHPNFFKVKQSLFTNFGYKYDRYGMVKGKNKKELHYIYFENKSYFSGGGMDILYSYSFERFSLGLGIGGVYGMSTLNESDEALSLRKKKSKKHKKSHDNIEYEDQEITYAYLKFPIFLKANIFKNEKFNIYSKFSIDPIITLMFKNKYWEDNGLDNDFGFFGVKNKKSDKKNKKEELEPSQKSFSLGGQCGLGFEYSINDSLHIYLEPAWTFTCLPLHKFNFEKLPEKIKTKDKDFDKQDNFLDEYGFCLNFGVRYSLIKDDENDDSDEYYNY